MTEEHGPHVVFRRCTSHDRRVIFLDDPAYAQTDEFEPVALAIELAQVFAEEF